MVVSGKTISTVMIKFVIMSQALCHRDLKVIILYLLYRFQAPSDRNQMQPPTKLVADILQYLESAGASSLSVSNYWKLYLLLLFAM